MGLETQVPSRYDFRAAQNNQFEKIKADVAGINKFVSGIDASNSEKLTISLDGIQWAANRVLEKIEEEISSLRIEDGLSVIDYAFDDLDQYPQVDFAKINLLVATLHDDVATFLRSRGDYHDRQSADTLNEKAKRYRNVAAQISATPAVQHHNSAVA